MALLIAGGHRGEGGRGDRNKLEELQEVIRVLVVNSKGWLENELGNNSLKSTLEKNKTSDLLFSCSSSYVCTKYES